MYIGSYKTNFNIIKLYTKDAYKIVITYIAVVSDINLFPYKAANMHENCDDVHSCDL